MSLPRCGGLSVDVHQLQGNSWALYVRLPGGWNGQRRIVHTHEGPCRADCAACCGGYDEQGAALIFLVATWAEQARPVLVPWNFTKRPLDQIIKEIAGGLHAKPAKKRKV